MRSVLAFFLAALSILAVEPVRDPNSGVYAIWLREGQSVDLPYIVGGQVVTQWRLVEPAEGHYDFSSIDTQLEGQQKLGRKTTIQINGNQHPDWLFNKVPYTEAKLSTQVNDRKGTLAYWHPAYSATYQKLIAALGEHVKASPLRGSILGVRLNFNAIGTEHYDVPEDHQSPASWTLPPGVDAPPAWTRRTMLDYRRAVVDAFIHSFSPATRVFVRNNLFITPDQSDPAWVQMLESGKLGLFHTSSEMEPRNAGGGQYRTFIRFCRNGQTVCYAEPWADATGKHGALQDARWSSPEQFNYWRVLSDLNCGVSFIALYGADLVHAAEPEYRAAFDFAAFYAGYHASPSASPGAWIALREGNNLKGDYSFLMQRDPATDMKPVQLAGPSNQRYGAWARVVPSGANATFTLDPAFSRNLSDRPATVRVIYLDNSASSFNIAAAGRISTISSKNTGRWQVAEIPIEKWSGGSITVSTSTDLTLHMIEIRR